MEQEQTINIYVSLFLHVIHLSLLVLGYFLSHEPITLGILILLTIFSSYYTVTLYVNTKNHQPLPKRTVRKEDMKNNIISLSLTIVLILVLIYPHIKE